MGYSPLICRWNLLGLVGVPYRFATDGFVFSVLTTFLILSPDCFRIRPRAFVPSVLLRCRACPIVPVQLIRIDRCDRYESSKTVRPRTSRGNALTPQRVSCLRSRSANVGSSRRRLRFYNGNCSDVAQKRRRNVSGTWSTAQTIIHGVGFD